MSVLGNNLLAQYYAQNSLSARSYIQNGLIAMWDGIENVGWGQHDFNSQTWIDLVGSRNATLVNSTFGDDAMLMQHDSYAETGSISLWTSSEVTIEFVFVADGTTTSGGYPCVFRETNDKYSFYRNSSTNYWLMKINNSSGAQRPQLSPFAKKPFFVFAGNGVTGYGYYSNLPEYNVLNINQFSAASDMSWHIGTDRSTTLGSDAKYHALRIYDRVLTLDELKKNHDIDKRRFNLQ